MKELRPDQDTAPRMSKITLEVPREVARYLRAKAKAHHTSTPRYAGALLSERVKRGMDHDAMILALGGTSE